MCHARPRNRSEGTAANVISARSRRCGLAVVVVHVSTSFTRGHCSRRTVPTVAMVTAPAVPLITASGLFHRVANKEVHTWTKPRGTLGLPVRCPQSTDNFYRAAWNAVAV